MKRIAMLLLIGFLAISCKDEVNKSENLPDITSVDDIKPEFWENRIKQINNFEKHITQNGTIVMKFFLHLSKDEQKVLHFGSRVNPTDPKFIAELEQLLQAE